MQTLKLLPLVLLLGCSSGGGAATKTTEYKHTGPNFKAEVPEGFTAGKDNFEDGGFASVSLRSADGAEEVFFSWGNLTPPDQALVGFERHRTKPDLTKIIEEGPLADGKGKFIHTLRGQTEFIHSIVVVGPVAVECTVSSPKSEAAKKACKTLLPW
jgi:hypothetical protein